MEYKQSEKDTVGMQGEEVTENRRIVHLREE